MAQSKNRPIQHRAKSMPVSSKGLRHDGPLINRLADATAGRFQAIDSLSATNDPATATASAPAYAMWGQVLGSWGAFDGNSDAARVTDSIGGLVTGVDVSPRHGVSVSPAASAM